MSDTVHSSSLTNSPKDYGLGKLPNKTPALAYQIKPEWLYAQGTLSQRVFEDEETALEVYNTLVFPEMNRKFQTHMAENLFSIIKHAEQCMYKMNDMAPESLSYMRDTVDFLVNRWRSGLVSVFGDEIASRLSLFVNPITETEGFLDNPYIGTDTLHKLYKGELEVDVIHSNLGCHEYFNKVALALSMKCLSEKKTLLELSKANSNT